MDKRVYADRREANIQSVTKRRNKIRLMAADYLGNQCCFCGYNRCLSALDFHHLDETKKNFTIRDGVTRSWSRVQKELENCILVCSNCHRELHSGLLHLALKIVD